MIQRYNPKRKLIEKKPSKYTRPRWIIHSEGKPEIYQNYYLQFNMDVNVNQQKKNFFSNHERNKLFEKVNPIIC